MRWECKLVDAKTGDPVTFETTHYLSGGNCRLGGINEAWLNVMYDYDVFFRRFYPEDSLCVINGKTGREAVPLLLKIVNGLSFTGSEMDRRNSNKKVSEKNAFISALDLLVLSTWAEDAVWRVTKGDGR